jgi:rod shape-determining protein MreC
VSAQSADGSAFGIVAAHLGDEPDRYLLEMRGVPLRTSLQPGTLIVSSGLGGVYPRGIPIGVVQRELRTSEVWANTYLLRPAVLPADMSTVMILHPQRAGAGVSGVWDLTSPDSAAADSARRADSLARERAPGARADTARARAARPAAPRVDTVRTRTAVPVRRDTGRRQAPVRRDTAPVPQDTAPRDTLQRDTVRRDTVRRDTTPPALPVTPVPPPPPSDTVRRDTTASPP